MHYLQQFSWTFPVAIKKIKSSTVDKCHHSAFFSLFHMFSEPYAPSFWIKICKLLRSPGINSKESIPLAYVAVAKVQCRHCCEIYYGENSLYRETSKSYLISTFPFRDFHFVLTYILCADKIHHNAIYFAAARSAKVSCCTSIQCWGSGAVW